MIRPDMIDFGRNSLRTLTLRLLGVGMALLHVQLLWRRFADGSLTDLLVAARWVASGALIAGMVVVYRRHGRLFRGRQAAVLWTLVALLHALSGVPGAAIVAEPAPWLVVPIAILAARGVAVLLERTVGPGPARALRRSPRRRRLVLPVAPAGACGSRAPPR